MVKPIVVPAQAGMILYSPIYSSSKSRCTRTSGDDPTPLSITLSKDSLYPHKRGWSHNQLCKFHLITVVPAQAGMILTYDLSSIGIFCCTRTSGDDPSYLYLFSYLLWLYPHKRGWSLYFCNSLINSFVVPAQAGMILRFDYDVDEEDRCTRTSGDDPERYQWIRLWDKLYPHKRGWSFTVDTLFKLIFVVPAQAGMIR